MLTESVVSTILNGREYEYKHEQYTVHFVIYHTIWCSEEVSANACRPYLQSSQIDPSVFRGRILVNHEPGNSVGLSALLFERQFLYSVYRA